MIDGDGLLHSSPMTTVLDPSSLTPDQMLEQADAFTRIQRIGMNSLFMAAAMWADQHPADSIDQHQLQMPGGDRPIHPGGDGTPEIARFCVAEFAATIGTSPGGGERKIGDALDLRHRLPLLWQRLCRYEVNGLDCQTIARDTHHLTLDQTLWIDQQVAHQVGQMSWAGFRNLLEAKIIEIDADNITRRVREAAAEIGVWLGQANPDGIKTIIARLPAPVAIWVHARIDHMAAVLARRGHTGTKDHRMAAALDVLTQPLLAMKYLAEDTQPDLFTDTDDAEPAKHSSADDPDQDQQNARPQDDDHHDCEYQDDGEVFPSDPTDDDGGCSCGTGRFPRIEQHHRLAEQTIAALAHIDPAKLRPDATLYVHIARETLNNGLGVTRVEDIGPMISSLVADWLADCNITVKPVIDLAADLTPVDAYEVPRLMRERMFLKHPGSIFPYSAATGRHLDLDHSIPYVPGVPGQTREDLLGPADRFGHRVITHSPWKRRQPEPGSYLFRAPHGTLFLVNQTGTHNLGCGTLADLIWHATAPTPAH